MSLVIDRDTQDGKIKLETLKWAEAQINNIFGLAFDRYYLMRGLRINFIIPEANDTNPNIQINLARAQPIDQASLEEALKEVVEKTTFPSSEQLEAVKKQEEALNGANKS